MKNAFRNIVAPDKLRGLPTKKEVTSLLILTVAVAALFATPTVSFASSNLRNGSSQSHTASVITIHSNTQPKPIIAIRMLDTMHGWALTDNSILKTVDGGTKWQNVTPKAQTFGLNIQGEFLTAEIAWVAWQSTQGYSGQMQSITILHTSNGGTNWQATTINNATGSLVDPPRFINPQKGWLVTSQGQGMMHALITTYQTTNGRQTWANISGQVDTTEVISNLGISFSNGQLGWAGLEWPGGHPMIEKTENGGRNWQPQSLPAPANTAQIDNVQTTAAVLIGTSGLLPAHISTGTSPQARLDIYTTHDTGATWTVGALANFDSNDVYTLDIRHIWEKEAKNNVLHVSSDGGKTWGQLWQTPDHFGALSFVDVSYGWAIGNSKLWHTTDGGRTWQHIDYSIQ